jgi:hypothetical protein
MVGTTMPASFRSPYCLRGKVERYLHDGQELPTVVDLAVRAGPLNLIGAQCNATVADACPNDVACIE